MYSQKHVHILSRITIPSPTSSSRQYQMEPIEPRPSKAKRRKLNRSRTLDTFSTASKEAVPCSACKTFSTTEAPLDAAADGSEITIKDVDSLFHQEDFLPDLPALQQSFENGCLMCGELRSALTAHPSFLSFSKVHSPAQSRLRMRLKASLQCAPNGQYRSLTFRAELMAGASAHENQMSPQVMYDIYTGERYSSH